jgi:uncharacterized Zn finger protein
MDRGQRILEGGAMDEDLYSCPACGSGRISREVVRPPKGKTNWDAPLGQWVGDHDVCEDCGHKWKPDHVVRQQKG